MVEGNFGQWAKQRDGGRKLNNKKCDIGTGTNACRRYKTFSKVRSHTFENVGTNYICFAQDRQCFIFSVVCSCWSPVPTMIHQHKKTSILWVSNNLMFQAKKSIDVHKIKIFKVPLFVVSLSGVGQHCWSDQLQALTWLFPSDWLHLQMKKDFTTGILQKTSM